MHLLFDILPVALFFIAFKFYGFYVATIVGMIATFLQVTLTRIFKKVWDRMQLVTLLVFLSFGSMTLYFHNPIFVKWKPTVVFWIFAAVILFTHFFAKKPLIQRLMEKAFTEKGASIADAVWKKLNLYWAIFFAALGAINVYVAYTCSNDVWVNFKFYGITSLLILFSIFQAIYLMRNMVEVKQ